MTSLLETGDRDWIETGGGSDEVYAGAGDDVVKVQGKQQDTVEFKVTVGTVNGVEGYVINGEFQPNLELSPGIIYIFDQSDPSNLGNELGISPSTNQRHGLAGYPDNKMKVWVTEANLNEELIYHSMGQTEDFPYGQLFRGGGQITAFELDQVIIDTGTGDDEVVVEEDWSGTLLLKNGGRVRHTGYPADDTVVQSVDGTDLKIVFSNGNEILIEDHYVLDANGAYEVGDTGFATIAVEGVEGVNNPFPDKELNVSQVLRPLMCLGFGAEEGEEINEDVVNTLFAEAGDDTVYIGGGYNQVIGGEGDVYFLHLCW